MSVWSVHLIELFVLMDKVIKAIENQGGVLTPDGWAISGDLDLADLRLSRLLKIAKVGVTSIVIIINSPIYRDDLRKSRRKLVMCELQEEDVELLNMIGDDLKKINRGESIAIDWLPSRREFQVSMIFRVKEEQEDGQIKTVSRKIYYRNTRMGNAIQEVVNESISRRYNEVENKREDEK